MTTNLDSNAISRMINSEESANDPSFHPIVQIIDIAPLNATSSSGQVRYRVIISDGIHHCIAMLATQNNRLIESNEIQTNTIIRAQDFMKNHIKGKTIVIILSLHVMETPSHVIGNPTRLDSNPTPNTSTNTRVGTGVNASASVSGGMGSNNYTPVVPKQESMNNSTYSSNNPYMSQPDNTRITSSSAPIVRSDPYAMGGGGGGGSYVQRHTPIAALNMYQNRWTLKARITNKTEVKHWSNAKGEGQLFSIEMLDASGYDIRATFFREAVDKFYPLLECDKVYTFAGGRLKSANMQYNNCKSDYEITFDQNAEIHLQNDDGGDISQQLYNFLPIGNLEEIEPGKFVDVIGVVKSVGEPGTIMSKRTGKELTKCEFTIVDDSGAEVTCTVWGERAMKTPTEFSDTPVVALRRARVSDYGGRTLSASGIHVRPNVHEASRVMTWWKQGGSEGMGVKKLSSSGSGGANRFPEFEQRKSIAAIKGENMGYTNPDKPEWLSFKGTVIFIKNDREGGAWYRACANADEPCKNRYKVEQGSDGMWACDRCGKSYDHCVYRYIFSGIIADSTASTWVSVFDDQAKVLLDGLSAGELNESLNSPDGGGQEAYDAVFQKAQFTDWIFTCKVKQENNQGEIRLKTSIQSLHKMDYAKEGRSLLNSILAM